MLQVAKDAQVDEKEDGPDEWTSYWKPNITINLVDDFTRYNCVNIYLDMILCCLFWYYCATHLNQSHWRKAHGTVSFCLL